MSLLTAVVETFTVTEATPEMTEEKQPEPIELPAVFQLEKRLLQMKREQGEQLRAEIKELNKRLAEEQKAIDAFANYDLREAAKAPDFDRQEASRLQAESLVATELARSIADDISAAEKRLRSIEVEFGRKGERLNQMARDLDVTRRATAMEFLRGSGKIKLDKDHVSRWLASIDSTEKQAKAMFPEDDWPLIETMMGQLTSYEIPTSTTDMLYGALHHSQLERFQKYAPTTTTTTNEEATNE